MPPTKSCMTCHLFDKPCSGPTKTYPNQCKECRDLISRGGTRLICRWITQDELKTNDVLQGRIKSKKFAEADNSDESRSTTSESEAATGGGDSDVMEGVEMQSGTDDAAERQIQWITEEHVGLILDLVAKDEDADTITILFQVHFPEVRLDEAIVGYIKDMVEQRKQSLLGKAFI